MQNQPLQTETIFQMMAGPGWRLLACISQKVSAEVERKLESGGRGAGS